MISSAQALERWRTFLENDRGRVELRDVTPADVAAFAAWRKPRLTRGTDGVASINRDLASFKSFLSWLVDTERLGRSPALAVKQAPEHRNEERIVVVDRATFERVVGQLEEHWADVAWVLRSTGMRWSSLHRVQVAHLDPTRRALKLSRPKGKWAVDLVLPQRAWEALGRAIGRPVAQDSGGFNQAVQDACRELGGVRPFTAHILRHTAAVAWLRGGVNIRQVQAWLGHASITTTERYLHFVDQAELPDL